MDATTQKLQDALRRAVQAEIEGHSFYLMAARSTQDPKGKEIFERLAAEEMDHANFLRAHFHALQSTGRLDPAAALGARTDLLGPSPIFSDALRRRIGEAHYEMTALSVGAQLEEGAMRFYREQGEASTDPKARDFFATLADWEQGHYRALTAQLDALREDYWTQNEFAPF